MGNLRLNVELEGARELSRMAAFLSPKLFDRALAGGVKYASAAAAPAISKAARAPGRYNIAAGAVRDDVGKPRFFDRGTTATIAISRQPRTVRQFGGRQTTRGYSFAIIKGERQSFRRGFVGRGPVAGLPMQRVRPGSEAKAAGGRSPIRVVHGPSVGSLFLGDSRFGNAMKKEVEERMSIQFIKGVKRELGRATRGY